MSRLREFLNKVAGNKVETLLFKGKPKGLRFSYYDMTKDTYVYVDVPKACVDQSGKTIEGLYGNTKGKVDMFPYKGTLITQDEMDAQISVSCTTNMDEVLQLLTLKYDNAKLGVLTATETQTDNGVRTYTVVDEDGASTRITKNEALSVLRHGIEIKNMVIDAERKRLCFSKPKEVSLGAALRFLDSCAKKGTVDKSKYARLRESFMIFAKDPVGHFFLSCMPWASTAWHRRALSTDQSTVLSSLFKVATTDFTQASMGTYVLYNYAEMEAVETPLGVDAMPAVSACILMAIRCITTLYFKWLQNATFRIVCNNLSEDAVFLHSCSIVVLYIFTIAQNREKEQTGELDLLPLCEQLTTRVLTEDAKTLATLTTNTAVETDMLNSLGILRNFVVRYMKELKSVDEFLPVILKEDKLGTGVESELIALSKCSGAFLLLKNTHIFTVFLKQMRTNIVPLRCFVFLLRTALCQPIHMSMVYTHRNLDIYKNDNFTFLFRVTPEDAIAEAVYPKSYASAIMQYDGRQSGGTEVKVLHFFHQSLLRYGFLGNYRFADPTLWECADETVRYQEMLNDNTVSKQWNGSVAKYHVTSQYVNIPYYLRETKCMKQSETTASFPEGERDFLYVMALPLMQTMLREGNKKEWSDEFWEALYLLLSEDTMNLIEDGVLSDVYPETTGKSLCNTLSTLASLLPQFRNQVDFWNKHHNNKDFVKLLSTQEVLRTVRTEQGFSPLDLMIGKTLKTDEDVAERYALYEVLDKGAFRVEDSANYSIQNDKVVWNYLHRAVSDFPEIGTLYNPDKSTLSQYIGIFRGACLFAQLLAYSIRIDYAYYGTLYVCSYAYMEPRLFVQRLQNSKSSAYYPTMMWGTTLGELMDMHYSFKNFMERVDGLKEICAYVSSASVDWDALMREFCTRCDVKETVTKYDGVFRIATGDVKEELRKRAKAYQPSGVDLSDEDFQNLTLFPDNNIVKSYGACIAPLGVSHRLNTIYYQGTLPLYYGGTTPEVLPKLFANDDYDSVNIKEAVWHSTALGFRNRGKVSGAENYVELCDYTNSVVIQEKM